MMPATVEESTPPDIATTTVVSEGFLSNPDDGINLFLFYGPDYGLSAERIGNLSKTLDVNVDDPFSSSNLKLEDIENNPSKLLEEALTHYFLGSQRLVIFKIYN